VQPRHVGAQPHAAHQHDGEEAVHDEPRLGWCEGERAGDGGRSKGRRRRRRRRRRRTKER
jgi:hypothetical protein